MYSGHPRTEKQRAIGVRDVWSVSPEASLDSVIFAENETG